MITSIDVVTSELSWRSASIKYEWQYLQMIYRESQGNTVVDKAMSIMYNAPRTSWHAVKLSTRNPRESFTMFYHAVGSQTKLTIDFNIRMLLFQRLWPLLTTTLTMSQWSSSGNPVCLELRSQCTLECYWRNANVLPVVLQWLSSGLPVCSNYAN